MVPGRLTHLLTGTHGGVYRQVQGVVSWRVLKDLAAFGLRNQPPDDKSMVKDMGRYGKKRPPLCGSL